MLNSINRSLNKLYKFSGYIAANLGPKLPSLYPGREKWLHPKDWTIVPRAKPTDLCWIGKKFCAERCA